MGKLRAAYSPPFALIPRSALMEPKPFFNKLRKCLNICKLLETTNGAPAIDRHKVKVKFVSMFSPSA